MLKAVIANTIWQVIERSGRHAEPAVQPPWPQIFSAFKETIASKELQFLGVLVHYQVDGELLTSVLKKTASMDHTALRQQP